MKPEAVQPVKYFVGALFSSEKLLDKAIELLKQHFGDVDHSSNLFSFTVTDYYNAEMGVPIYRRFFSFSDLKSPGFLSESKLITNTIEMELAVRNRRKVNLDIGYIDYDKVVLASAKYGIHKVYLDNGIYADIALHYEKGKFSPYPWAFMDFRSRDYHPFFLKIRGIYKSQVKHTALPG